MAEDKVRSSNNCIPSITNSESIASKVHINDFSSVLTSDSSCQLLPHLHHLSASIHNQWCVKAISLVNHLCSKVYSLTLEVPAIASSMTLSLFPVTESNNAISCSACRSYQTPVENANPTQPPLCATPSFTRHFCTTTWYYILKGPFACKPWTLV